MKDKKPFKKKHTSAFEAPSGKKPDGKEENPSPNGQVENDGGHPRKLNPILAFVIAFLIVIGQFLVGEFLPGVDHTLKVSEIPPYAGEPFVVINEGQPMFRTEELVTEAYEYYSPLDELGRCGVTMACVGREIMPTEDRESISQVKPTGWVQNFYDFVDGEALYNRCHLIGFQLTGENANEKNLITGTRHLNVDGMLPFENMIADYVKETGNHVLYRVTPIYAGDDLVARGVQMEAYSVEDGGEGVCFHVFCYNVQPGVIIDYATGENKLAK